MTKEEEEKGDPGGKEKQKKKSGGGPPPNIQPKPKLTKAERRALQEQQRAAKAAGRQQGQQGQGQSPKGGGGGGGIAAKPQSTTTAPPGAAQSKQPPTSAKSKSPTASVGPDLTPKTSAKSAKPTFLFSHLQQQSEEYDIFDGGSAMLTSPHAPENLHPAVIQLGYMYRTGKIRGGNNRCRAMLLCYQTLLRDFVWCSKANNKDVRTILDHVVLKPAFQYWTIYCRTHSVSMGNAFTFLKTAVASLPRDMSLQYMKTTLIGTIDSYQKERIEYADFAIAELAHQKLFMRKQQHSSSSQTILVYGYSEAVYHILQYQQQQQQQKGFGDNNNNQTQHLRIIVADSPPLWEGRKLLEKLNNNNNNKRHPQQKQQNGDHHHHVDDDDDDYDDKNHHGHDLSYIPLSAVTYVLQEVDLVLLGAAALMSDGSVTGRVGTATIAMAAHNYHVPVLVCAETYKISNRVQLESITSNELLVPTTTPANKQQQQQTKVKKLDLLFDLLPASFVSGIVTECGIVPPSSVAVLLREMNPLEIRKQQQQQQQSISSTSGSRR